VSTRPLYIFDLDGTLADIRHRRHLVEGKRKRWQEFYEACVHDGPNAAVVRTALGLQLAGADVWVWSGRSDLVEHQTRAWLQRYLPTADLGRLRMRREGDFTADDVLKRSWLAGLNQADRARLVAVFDDRDKVVAMWREAGVPCFQVAPGEF